ncbi:M28 family peptidase [bacterium]|nr:M28 family peptidase [bacterium]
MRPRKYYPAVCVLLTVLLTASSSAQFSGTAAHDYIKKLCEPEFRGRKTGEPGSREAALWIAERFQEWGLRPGGDAGFIQEFPMLVTVQKETAELTLENGLFGRAVYTDGNDFVLYFNSGSGRGRADVVFAGFGISEPRKGRDDYAAIDARGKAVLIYRNTPKDGQDWSKENGRDYKMNTAAAHGAVAVLMLEQREFPVKGATIPAAGYQPGLPAYTISKKVARDFFQGTMKQMDEVLREAERSEQSFPMNRSIVFRARVDRRAEGVGENVVGILPGSDPELKAEVIVVGGHMDHNGLAPSGHLYPGADDNASGTAVVMELARLLASREEPLKRTVIFAGFGGEEQGLLGSTFFAAYPPVEAGRICAMFNFDMEGTGDGGAGFGGLNYFPRLLGKAVENVPEEQRPRLRVTRGWGFGGSDHAPFIQQGIPAIGFFSTGGHPFYHRVEDTPETINPASLQFVGDRAAELLVALADAERSLLYNGNARGRCFVLFGDQIDFAPLPKGKFEKCLHHLAGVAPAYAHRAVAVDIGSWQAKDLCRSLNAAEKQIRESGDLLLYENSGALGAAAGSGSIAAALGLNGTAGLAGDADLLHDLAKLGLSVLHIDDTGDPVFSDGMISDWGRTVLDICAEGKVLVDLCFADGAYLKRITACAKGATLAHAGVEAMLADLPACKEVLENSHVIISLFSEDGDAGQISQLMDRVDVSRLHLEARGHRGSKEVPHIYETVQKLYELRTAISGPEKAYDEMTALLGGNLRRVLY